MKTSTKPLVTLSDRYVQAVAYAAEQHAKHTRKGTNTPYVCHLIGVSSLVLEADGDEEQAIAGLLHDVIEDCNVTPAEITARFGERVAQIVIGCSDVMHSDEKADREYGERKQTYLNGLELAPAETVLVSIADKVHNARAIVTDLHETGAEVLDKFNGEPEAILTYYRECLRIGKAKGITTKLLIPLEIAVEEIAGYVPATSVA
jgi:(p)ppGpp synthase/HD superfamily hydrolase